MNKTEIEIIEMIKIQQKQIKLLQEITQDLHKAMQVLTKIGDL